MEQTQTHKLAIFDIDDTIVNGQSQKLLLKYLKKDRHISFLYFLRIYVWFVLYKLNLVKSPRSVFEYAIAFLKDKTIQEVDTILTDFMQKELSKAFYKKATELILQKKKDDYRIVLLSNAIEPLVKTIATVLGVDEYISTKLEVKNNIYTGKINGSIAYGKEKVKKLSQYINLKSYSEIEVYTDHHSDIPLLELATEPIATNPTKLLKEYALKNNWNIVYF